MKNNGNLNKNKLFSERLMALQMVFVLLVGLFIIYLFAVQVMDLKHNRLRARNQRKASTFVMRGNIYDRNGIKLVTDTVY